MTIYLVAMLIVWTHESAVLGKYVEYRPGTSHIILSVPHGGNIKPTSVKSRDFGCWRNRQCVWSHNCGRKDKRRCKASYIKDYWTLELAEHLADNLEKVSGKRPHLVINNIHRSRLDTNREIKLGTFGIPAMERAWRQYHQYIRYAKTRIRSSGLLLDIHGQAHKENWIELGYVISRYQLNQATNQMYRTSSIRHLSGQTCASFLDLLRGRTSLGGYLQWRGYRAVPSPSIPSPMAAPYFSGGYYSGGYTVQQHGSRRGGTIDAIQIESPKSLRSSTAGPSYSYNLALAIHYFIEAHKKCSYKG